MGKTELLQVTKIVEGILSTDLQARNNDDYLYIRVCERFNPMALNIAFQEAVLNRKEYGIPPFESVRRSRQRLQEKKPYLAGSEIVEGHRKANEEVYRDFSRG